MIDVGRQSATEAAAAVLAGDPRFRVLRRLDCERSRRSPANAKAAITGVCLDVETTGLDHSHDVIIELAMTPFTADADGRIIEVGRARRWLEDPRRPLSPEIARLTRLTDGDLRGNAIPEGEASCLLIAADVVFAHNASFDRPFVEERLPLAKGRPWVCTLREIDWRAAGYEGASLPHLLMQMGVFYNAHRADVDVAALLRLLRQTLPSGRTVLAESLDRAAARSWRVDAIDAPYGAKDRLKARRYRWDQTGRTWSIEVGEAQLDSELAWLRADVYGGNGSPRVEAVDWTTRHGR